MACQLGARPPTKGFTFTMHLVDAPELDFKCMAPHAKRNLKPSTCHTETHNTGRTPIHGPGLRVSSFCKRRICLFESRCFFLPRPGSLVEAGIHPQPGKTRGQGCRVQAAGTLVVFSAGTFVCRRGGFRASFWLCSRVRVRFGVHRMTNEWNCDLQVMLQTTKCFTPTTDSTTMMDML